MLAFSDCIAEIVTGPRSLERDTNPGCLVCFPLLTTASGEAVHAFLFPANNALGGAVYFLVLACLQHAKMME